VNLTFALDPELTRDLVEKLERIWLDVGNAGGSVGTPIPATLEDVKTLSNKAFRSVTEGDDHLVVASLEGDPVGFGFLTHNPGTLFEHWAIVKRLQVLPELQGKGIGSALMQEITRLAKNDLRLEQLQLTVRGETGTESFYERFGYEIVGRIPGAIRVAPGDDRDMIYMMARL
jgi:GNAT superfamily N-acetyltransferase